MSTKTLGPFTGRQLTTIIVALILAVAVPTAAYGFTVGHTAVTDATSHATASVTPTGSLQVAVALPSKPITITTDLPFLQAQSVYGPVAQPFAIGSITVQNGTSSDGYVSVNSTTAVSGGTQTFNLFLVFVAAGRTQHLDFPVPIVVTPPTGGTAGLSADNVIASGGTAVHLTVVGYQT